MKIAALIIMAVALSVALPARAQTASQPAAPRAEANLPPKGSAARGQLSAVQSAVPRQSAKMQAAGSESGTGTAPLAANQAK